MSYFSEFSKFGEGRIDNFIDKTMFCVHKWFNFNTFAKIAKLPFNYFKTCQTHKIPQNRKMRHARVSVQANLANIVWVAIA
jgi:hypothetical protein